MEVSSLNTTLFSFLILAFLANRLASTLTTFLCVCSNVLGFPSLNCYDMSVSKPLGNLINARSGGGLILAGIAL